MCRRGVCVYAIITLPRLIITPSNCLQVKSSANTFPPSLRRWSLPGRRGVQGRIDRPIKGLSPRDYFAALDAPAKVARTRRKKITERPRDYPQLSAATTRALTPNARCRARARARTSTPTPRPTRRWYSIHVSSESRVTLCTRAFDAVRARSDAA